MAILRRYSGQSTYEDRRGNTHSRAYTRVSRDREYFTVRLETRSTFDILSLQYYGSPLMYWLIADFNDYLDPDVILMPGDEIKIPRVQ